jgi:hypothetical protein
MRRRLALLRAISSHRATRKLGRFAAENFACSAGHDRLMVRIDAVSGDELLHSTSLLAAHPDMPIFKLDRNTARGVFNYIRSIQD